MPTQKATSLSGSAPPTRLREHLPPHPLASCYLVIFSPSPGILPLAPGILPLASSSREVIP